jgi:hypothetical protein
MERTDQSEILDLDGGSPVLSSDGSVTLVQAEEAGKEAKVFRATQGRKNHSNVDVEERYLQQRAVVPERDVFK